MRPLVVSLVLAAGASAAAPTTLQQLIDRARANDHRVRESHAQLRWFKAKSEEARWAWFPRLDTYFLVGGPTPEARNDGLGGPPQSRATRLYDLDFGEPGLMVRAGAEAVLPVYTFGKLDALEAMGAKGVQLGEALEARQQDEVELQVVQAYWGYCLAASARTVIADTLKRLDDARATLERLRAQESAQVTEMDVFKLDYYRKQAEVQLSQADAGAGFSLAALRLLIAAGDGEALELSPELTAPDGALLPAEAYLAEARLHRPELRAIEAAVGAREQEVLLRERMYYPDFGLGGFFRWAWTSNATRQLSPFAADPYHELNGGVALVMRYQWDFPQKSVQLEQARAELEKLQHQRALLTAAVRLDVEKAWHETNDALTRSSTQAQAEKSARRWATAAFAAFDVGTGDTRELVDAYTALALSTAARFLASHDARVGLGSLTKAVGHRVELAPRAPAAPLPAALTPRERIAPR